MSDRRSPSSAARGLGGAGLAYAALSFALRQPRLLRAVAALLRRWPRLLGRFGVARHHGVASALHRPCAFAGTAHQPNLVAGEFVIGMAHDPRHHADRALIERVLGDPTRCGVAAAARAQSLVPAALAAGTFDLVDDLLGWTMWAGLTPVLHGHADAIAHDSAPGAPADPARALTFFHELRHIGAHLLVGQVAPAPLQSRAQSAAAALRARIERVLPQLAAAWQVPDIDQARRVAVGLPWVGHPASVQAGALLVGELLARPRLLARLQEQARASAVDDPSWRTLLRAHVLELLRFNPVFPIVQRDVPRATLLDVGAARPVACAAGSTLRVLLIGAMHDPAVCAQPHAYRPQRSDPAAALLHFGLGPRHCPGREHALHMLVSALAVLLAAGRWQRPRGTRTVHDGPVIRHLPLSVTPFERRNTAGSPGRPGDESAGARRDQGPLSTAAPPAPPAPPAVHGGHTSLHNARSGGAG